MSILGFQDERSNELGDSDRVHHAAALRQNSRRLSSETTIRGRRIGMQFRKCATWFHSLAVAAASCGFKIALTGTKVGNRRMTTIRLINAGGSVASVSCDDRTGSACRVKKKKKEKGRTAVFMYADQLFIQHIVKTRERGERNRTRECTSRREEEKNVTGERGNATASASDRRETSSFMLGCCNSEWTWNGSKLCD